MVEMRWLVREYEVRYDDIDGVAPEYIETKVLQWRQYKDPHLYDPYGWTEWKDVPTVTEE
jgi:hypothetical protein